MKTLYVMDPLDSLHLEGDSTIMMLVEANNRSWTTFWCTPDDLYAIDGKSYARATQVVIQLISIESPVSKELSKKPVITEYQTADLELGQMDVIWMRKDPPFNMDYIFSTYLLDLVPPTTLVLNDPRAIRNFNEKMFALHFPQYSPKTLVTREIKRAINWAKNEQKVVIKPSKMHIFV